jgi:hypothetical protein
MALVVYDRVQETTTTSGTGSVTLLGAVSGFQSFAVVGNTNTTYYTITDGAQWEVGIGTYSTSGPTLARTTVLSNSNGNTTPITLSGGLAQVFVTYTAEKSVNLDASDNVTPLGTIASGTWQGTTVGVSYGGTGVTASSGANSVVLRDANQNTSLNNIFRNTTSTVSAAGTTVLTAASSFTQVLTGTTTQTYQLPDATTLANGASFQFNNNSTGALSIVNNGSGAVATVAAGGASQIFLTSTSTANGTWDVHGFIPENILWGTNSLYLNSDVITGGTWNGGTIGTAYGGTGLTTFTTNGALYATSTSSLTSGTLPTTAGGTGLATYTTGDIIYASATNTLAKLGVGSNGQVLTLASGIPSWASSSAATTRTTSTFTATASQTTFTVSYTVGLIDVYRNGAKLADTDYTATNGTTVVLNTGANDGDTVETVAYSALSIGTGVTSFSTGTTGLTPTSGSGNVTLGGTLAVANGGTGVTTSTGTGNVVLSISPTLVTPILGTPTSGTLTNCTGYTTANLSGTINLTSQVTGTLPVANGGTNASSAGIAAFNNITGYTASGATGTTSTNLVFSASPTFTGTLGAATISASANISTSGGTISDSKGDVRAAPIQSKVAAYVLVATDAGQTISITTGGVTVNASIFSAGDMVSIFNNSGSSQTITQGASVTLRLSGTATTGNRTLAQYGVATLLCVVGGATPTFACTGSGLT